MATVSVDFYKNFSKRQNSTKQPLESSAKDSYSCYIKDNCRITEPVIEIVLTGSTPLSPVNPAKLGYNYAYISDFSRYYFVNDWNYYKGTWTASLSVDVLASFKTEIGAESHYVLRTKNAYTIEPSAVQIPDTLYPATNSKKIYTQALSSAQSPFNYNNGSYVIGIINGGVMSGIQGQGISKYYVCTPAQIRQLADYLMGTDFANDYLVDAVAGATENVVKDFVDPLQYISSLRWYPFSVPASATGEKPKVGWWDTSTESDMPTLYPVTNISVLLTNSNLVIYHNPHAIETGKEFTKYSPYISYKLKFDPWGMFDLDSQLLSEMAVGNTIKMSITVDLISGMGRLDLSAFVGNGCELGSHLAMVGVNIELAQITQDIVSTGAGIGQTALSKVANWIEDKTGWSGFKKGTDKGSIIATGIMSALGLGKVSLTRAGSQDSMLSYVGYNSLPELIAEYYDCVGVDVEEAGQPLCKKVTLNTLEGYVLCGGVDTEVACMNEEKTMINNYLNGGFFYE